MYRKGLLALALFGALDGVKGAQYTVTPSDDWRSRITSLQAGDTMTFTKGTYTITGKFSVNFPGTAAAPIIVKGEEGAIIKRDDASQNVMDVGSGSYFTIQNIEFVGGSKGLRFGESGNIDNAKILDNSVHGTTTTAVTFNDGQRQYTNILVSGNEIYDTGDEESECLYMGCNQNACALSNSIIENNFCHDTLQATSGSLGSGIQVKTGSYKNIIRNNVIVDTKGPGVLIYDDYDKGENLVTGNFIWRAGDNGIQATAGAIITNNIISQASGSGIAIQANQPQPGSQIRNVDIKFNTIIGDSGIYVGNTDQGATFTISNNAVFSDGTPLNFNLAGSTSQTNGVTSGASGSNIQVGAAATELISTSATTPNYYPQAGSKLIGKGTSDAAVTVDFNGQPRKSPPTIGAYEHSDATNPGWQLSKNFKARSDPASLSDAKLACVVGMLPFIMLLVQLFL